MDFATKLDKIIEKNNSLLCVGLDPVLEKLPKKLQNKPNPLFAFNKSIIDQTHDLVCCFKPNSAFYEAYGADGIEQLKMTCDYIRKTYRNIPILLDFKRGDIGNTNEGYVKFAFDYLQVDAVTLHPYLGKEAMQPFLDRKGKGCVILCKTSNPGSGELQNVDVAGEPLYHLLAKKVVKEWNSNNNCMMVVGATFPEELKKIRSIAKDMFFLIPGIGAQGGDLEKTLQNGLRSDKSGLLISSSRGIIFASNPKEEAERLRNAINTFR